MNRTRNPVSPRLLVALAATLPVVAPHVASAQAAGKDTAPPLPNVMLLVDTSGSMEFDIAGGQVACNLKDASLTSEPATSSSPGKTRWTDLVEVLTGEVTNYGCYTEDRSCPSSTTSAFQSEYALGATPPADCNYYLPYHRILSQRLPSGDWCTVGPGTHTQNKAFDWPNDALHTHPWDSTSASATCPWNLALPQSATGLLDSFSQRARFGLMTFDSLTDPGSGVSGSSTTVHNESGVAGAWSYFVGWDDPPASGYATGRPGGCDLPVSAFEVGARNAAAPPWEGRMISFGAPDADISAVLSSNDKLQQALVAVRPFGATPINGLLSDALDFFRNDTSANHVTASSCNATTGAGCFGPVYDPYVKGGCRGNFVILLSDGDPNLDLRPFCEETGGVCPYAKRPDEIAAELYAPTDGSSRSIETFVVGFAVSNVTLTGGATTVDCSTIGQNGASDFGSGGVCGATMDPNLAACCNLAKIAYYGGTSRAHFATNPTELRQAVSDILSQIAGTSTSRTYPVFTTTGAVSSSFAASYTFLSSFYPNIGTLWDGVLERQRTVCVKDPSATPPTVTPVEQAVDATKGDSFGANVNAADGAHPRAFYTVVPTLDGGGALHPEGTLRPSIPNSNPDGVGTLGGARATGDATSFIPPTVPTAMVGVTASDCATPTPAASSDQECATRIMKWEIGATNGALPNRVGHAFGDIYHATPRLVGPPSDYLRDESYQSFAIAQARRPLVLYTATNDGQLHAFRAEAQATGAPVNNELWSFFPPAVVPNLVHQYSSAHQQLLDGAPMIKDVIFSRTKLDAQAGTGSWHTVLVAGFGAGGGGYYALDVTSPVPDGTDAAGPKLLWQLTTDGSGQRLFGKRGATPVITTLFFDPSPSGNGADPQEIAVALLPGGDADGPVACDGSNTIATPSSAFTDTDYAPRDHVNCYSTAPESARSLTIVRIDTGEIIRTFRSASDTPASLSGSTRKPELPVVTLGSPIVGTPVVFPATTGAVGERAFVGDRDGRLWRVGLTATDPKSWTMDLFVDAYPSGTVHGTATEGQPIITPPVVSVDNTGNLTVAFSTGDQETFTTSGTNYVWSVLEQASVGPYRAKTLWYSTLHDGERVSGPITLFNSVLYFSTFSAQALTNNVCSAGASKLWGVDYLQPLSALDPSQGGAARLLNDASVYVQSLSLGDGTTVFGIGVRQQPTCAIVDDSPSTDTFLGSGAHYGISSVTTGQFQLVVQTGNGGTSQNNATTKTITRSMPQPPVATRIDSWAAILEP